jgi:hypothetical protein
MHHTLRVRLLIVTDDGAKHLDTRMFGKRAFVTAQPLAVGGSARRALDDEDLALVPKLFEQITRLAISDLVIVGADIDDELPGSGLEASTTGMFA